LVDRQGVWRERWVAGSVPSWEVVNLSFARYQPRFLSDSGRVFFDSADGLVSQDTNGVEDVYEYEPVGVGDCSVSSVTFVVRSGGCVSLMSSGTSGEESAFLDASESGGDVFFLTSAGLSGLDVDNEFDVYDAHECSVGSPCIGAAGVSSPACVSLDACRDAPSPQPALFGAPASSTFSGPGNPSSGGSPATHGAVTPCSSSAGAPSKACSRKQNLTKAVTACKRRYPHSKPKRSACEQAAEKKYGPTRTRKTK
jgi:hypothetical protein